MKEKNKRRRIKEEKKVCWLRRYKWLLRACYTLCYPSLKGLVLDWIKIFCVSLCMQSPLYLLLRNLPFSHNYLSPIISFVKTFRFLPLNFYIVTEIWYISKLTAKSPSMCQFKSSHTLHLKHVEWIKCIVFKNIEFYYTIFWKVVEMITC